MGYLINTISEGLEINSIKLNFLPSWWNGNYGLRFGSTYVFDPIFRAKTFRMMKRTVRERYSGIQFDHCTDELESVPPDFGNALIPALAGCSVEYPDIGYPWSYHLEAEKAKKLSVPDNLSEAFPFSEIVRQTGELNEFIRNASAVWLPIRGILNDAFLISGDKLFLMLTDGSEEADELLDYCLEVIRKTVRENKRFDWDNELIVLMNCANMMVSKDFYEDILFSYELKAYEHITANNFPFGIHHCGKIDNYLDSYRKFSECKFLEIGWGSDIKKTLQIFPEAEVQYIFSASFLLNEDEQKIRNYVETLLENISADLNRFSLAVPDIEYGTPDNKIKTIVEICSEVKV